VVSTKYIDPRVLEFVVSNITATTTYYCAAGVDKVYVAI
jgi:hypothetical protein